MYEGFILSLSHNEVNALVIDIIFNNSPLRAHVKLFNKLTQIIIFDIKVIRFKFEDYS